MRTANPTNAASGTRKACPGKSAGYSDLAGLPIRKRACNRLIQFKKLISFQAFGCQGSILGNFFAFVFLRLTCLTELVGYQLRTHFFIFSPPKRRTQNPLPHSQPPDSGAFFLVVRHVRLFPPLADIRADSAARRTAPQAEGSAAP